MLAMTAALVVASGSPFNVDWSTDGISTASLATIYLIGEGVVKPGLTGAHACRVRLKDPDICDPTQLNALDRSVIDNHSAGWALASNVLQYATFSMALSATAIDASNDDGNRLDSWGRDAIVLTETVLLSQLATNILKYSMRRARPSQYVIETDVTLSEEQLSFPSGHTSSVAAAATAYTYAFAERHPNDGMRYVVGGIGAALTIATGYARAQAGRHFYTDVIAGAALGVAIGYLVPWLHRMSPDDTVAQTNRQGSPMLTFATAF